MLSVTPGDGAAAQLRAAGVAAEVLPWRDLLHEGPIPAGLDAGTLARVRAGYIRSVGWPGAERAEAELTERDEALAAAAAEPVEIVLWFDHNLVDRLALLQVLDRLAQLRGPGLPDVTLAEPHGFGDADADALAALFDRRAAVTGAQLARPGRLGRLPRARPDRARGVHAGGSAGRAGHGAGVLNGVDHWLGGVHLTGATSWRYDPSCARPARTG